MEYRFFGRTGIKVSSFCLGTGALGNWGNKNEEECIRIVNEAIANGINFIDTADVYSGGETEKILGKALKGQRTEVILGTKGGLPMGNGQNQKGSSKIWIRRAVEGSLRRLQTDYVDLYQLHVPDPYTDIEETLEVLTDLVKEGKIRYIGTSSFQAWQIVEAQWVSERRNLVRFVSEQPPYSIINRSVELDVLAAADKYGLGVLVWSPLSGGLLTGKYIMGQQASADSRAVRIKGSPLADRVNPERQENRVKFEVINQLKEIADQVGMTLAHMAMAFTQEHPSVTASIIGPRTPAQLHEILKGSNIRLNFDILDKIDSIVAPGKTLDDLERGWAPEWLSHQRRYAAAK
ncbi:aldo/keto reductase [Pectinatus haikarae]|uniref:aldo/keto reductase n=1 Tax=Pectinatus haikarae TaxID=349096 RepID=UPI0018C4F7DE